MPVGSAGPAPGHPRYSRADPQRSRGTVLALGSQHDLVKMSLSLRRG